MYVGYDNDIYRTACYNPTGRIVQTPMQDTPGYPDSSRFGSAHASGCNMAFCDGAVQPIHYSIDPGGRGSIVMNGLTAPSQKAMLQPRHGGAAEAGGVRVARRVLHGRLDDAAGRVVARGAVNVVVVAHVHVLVTGPLAASCAACTAGSSSAIRMPMIVMTTKSSTSVKPRLAR